MAGGKETGWPAKTALYVVMRTRIYIRITGAAGRTRLIDAAKRRYANIYSRTRDGAAARSEVRAWHRNANIYLRYGDEFMMR